jgi:hypothetical protein
MTMPLPSPLPAAATATATAIATDARAGGRALDPRADLARRRWLQAFGLTVLGVAPAGRVAHAAGGDGGVVIVGHPGLGRLSPAQVVRLYTGRMIELDNQSVSVVNAPAGSPLRLRFLQQYLQQDDADYRAYWTVRRHIGKGLPPPELPTAADVLRHVGSQPGGIGYIDAADLRLGLNVLLR